MILPSLQEAESPYWRPIKYSLFPPLGLATLAAYFCDDDEVEIVDQHVERLTLDDEPDLVCIQVYPGRHLYFLDDHLLGSPRFAEELFEGMRGMGRVFQSAATIASVLKGDLIEKAAEAGLRSIFLGFETFSPENLRSSNKLQNLSKDYVAAVERLHSLGIMINGSFVFGLDYDDKDVFRRTVEWGIEHSITTATFHILTPYPGTRLFQQMELDGRITSYDWSKYDTRTVVYKTIGLSADELKQGYDWAYKEFYSWSNIFRASFGHDNLKQQLAHLFYMGGWKKFEPFWNFMIQCGQLNRMLPMLESLLANTKNKKTSRLSLS